MRILFVGDIYGRSGREALAEHLPKLEHKLDPDVIIVNGENAAHGRGINEKICKSFYELGVDIITTGNHVWDQREVIPYIQQSQRLIRPINFPPGTPGSGAAEYQLDDGRTLKVINAMGRIFMDPIDDPFRSVSEALANERLGQTSQAIFVDFHGETTSEKLAFANYFDGKVSAVVGTHTHIPTADAHILKNGTGYQTDAGMTGDYDSIIGADKQVPIQRFVTKMPVDKMRPAGGTGTLCGVMIVTNDNTGRTTAIDRVCVGPILKEYIPEI
ncbi:MAG: TIGR00282 family metallophosphoesterase [Micavibrio sp.]|nr:TIGR00282 family metallophosphoesterase [Micavibrio sp.]|tara:strand:- start:1605 stop:2420 length:816 start_codon:yes stop_codon:yes gene_type:complete